MNGEMWTFKEESSTPDEHSGLATVDVPGTESVVGDLFVDSSTIYEGCRVYTYPLFICKFIET